MEEIPLNKKWGFREWKTLKALGKAFGYDLESMEILIRKPGFPSGIIEKGKRYGKVTTIMYYNYYDFRIWLKTYDELQKKRGQT